MRTEELDTPAVVIDRAIVEANLRRAQAHADACGIRLRPHIKTHKLPLFARRQVEWGAVGITCQKLGEAEVMADAGLHDILVPYNILGREKLARLAALHRRIRVAVSADSLTTVEGYAELFPDAAHPLAVMVECDTGAARCGVQTPAEALTLAQRIEAAPGLHFAGLLTYPPRGGTAATEAWFRQALALFEGTGVPIPAVSNGGSPDFFRMQEVRSATEHRPGTYIYCDRMQVAFGHATLADCALSVLATVVSRPTPDRAVLDAGSKALAADACLAPGFGHVVEYPDAVVTNLSEEHAVADLSRCAERPSIGEKVRVIPNHACVVSNLFDAVHLVENGQVLERVPVAARGLMA